jgi:hypothetical protein
MSSRPYKPPPESLAFQVLKVFCTLLALALVAGIYLVIFWGITLLHPPPWLALPAVVLYLVSILVTYLLLKWTTTLGRYLCDVPPYLSF